MEISPIRSPQAVARIGADENAVAVPAPHDAPRGDRSSAAGSGEVCSAEYYLDLTREYIRYGAGTFTWHYGLWEEGVSTHAQALLQANERLVKGLDLTPDTRILDVGCGMGGFAVWVAKKFGCRVTGITNCASHVGLAQLLAVASGVSGQCEFRELEMGAMDFAEHEFDVIVNLESLSHAPDKRRYLENVHYILKPGGTWRALAFALRESALDPAEEADIKGSGKDSTSRPSCAPRRSKRSWRT